MLLLRLVVSCWTALLLVAVVVLSSKSVSLAFLPPQPQVSRRTTTTTTTLQWRLFGTSTNTTTVAATTSTSTRRDDGWLQSDLEEAMMKEGGASISADVAPDIDKEQVVGPDAVLIYDTTLRDGTQGESVSVSCDDKLKIASRLASFGVDYIEAGWPGSNPKDEEFFARAKTQFPPEVRDKLVAFGSTRRKSCRVEEDAQIAALLQSGVPTLCVVAKAHAWQVTDILRATLEENLQMISDSVAYLRAAGGNNDDKKKNARAEQQQQQQEKRVFVDLEHFFDGYLHDADYTMQCCEAAVAAGARCLVLCDTNGGTMPWHVSRIARTVVRRFPSVTVGIHTHNDAGVAVANSLAAIQAGVGLVQGTINGVGERTGNADLCSIVPTLALKFTPTTSTSTGTSTSTRTTTRFLNCRSSVPQITSLSRFVDEVLNRSPNAAAPYVGSSAFAHKGGLHVAAMERSPLSYQHIDPTAVGNEKRVLVSELSGRQNILSIMMRDDHLASAVHNGNNGGNTETSPAVVAERASAILKRVKDLERIGYTFEGAEASVRLMILHATRGYCPPFSVLDYTVQVYDTAMDSASRVVAAANDGEGDSQPKLQRRPQGSGPTARATVKVRTLNLDEELYSHGNNNNDNNGDFALLYTDRLEVSDGAGPVDALASALQRALLPSHPYLAGVGLVDYKVRILDPETATAAATRVMIEFRDNVKQETWTTVSVDRNVISASLNALVDGFEYALIEHASSCMLCDDAY